MIYGVQFFDFAGIPGPDVHLDQTPRGAWLASYDPDAHDGQGLATWTTDQAEAMRFESAAAAFACWRSTSTVRPIRDDGRPNRPLTSASIMVSRLDAT